MYRVFLIALIISLSGNSFAEDKFDRNQAIETYKSECQLELVLAMGLSSQKQDGKSKAELEKIASGSKDPKIMNVMVKELFSKPELGGGTYMFYRFENCLISREYKVKPVKLDDVRPSLMECDEKNLEMEELVGCIDAALLKKYKKF